MAPEESLSALQVALRIEAKMDRVLEDHEERLRVVERSGIVLRGVWVTMGVITSVVAGSAGLIIGVLAYTGSGTGG